MGIISKQLLKVIEWKDDAKDVLVYRVPTNGEIMMGSKLIVRESQVAIFVNNGRIGDVFQPGTHTLHTSNLPFITALLALPYGFKSQFKAEVYFVNTKQFPNQKWGTSNPITMRDPDFGMIRIRGFGSFSFKVDEPSTFMKELFGTNSSFKTSDIVTHLKSLLITGITDTIASSKIGALDMASNLFEFADQSKATIQNKFKEFGLRVAAFNIENLSFPEEVEKAIDQRSSLGVLGDKMGAYMQYQTGQAMRDAAKNEGMGGMGASMGMGMAMSQMMANNVSGGKGAQDAPAGACPKCKKPVPGGAQFCPSCGTAISNQFCKGCGAKLAAGAKFCPECGAKTGK